MSGVIICPFCFLGYRNNDNFVSTSCGHIFHSTCLETWNKSKKTCPTCRQNYKGSHKIFPQFKETTNNKRNENTNTGGKEFAELQRKYDEEVNKNHNLTKVIKKLKEQLANKKRYIETIEISDSDEDSSDNNDNEIFRATLRNLRYRLGSMEMQQKQVNKSNNKTIEIESDDEDEDVEFSKIIGQMLRSYD